MDYHAEFHHRARLQGRARRITIDLDPTDDSTHGQQEFTFFNGHYDTWCYLPLVATLTFNAEPTQYLVAAVQRRVTGRRTRPEAERARTSGLVRPGCEGRPDARGRAVRAFRAG
jgi:hypothetical protein